MGGVDNCDVTSGQCSCKTNVVNSFCSSCAVGFYNLTETNPDGCQGTYTTAQECILMCLSVGEAMHQRMPVCIVHKVAQ